VLDRFHAQKRVAEATGARRDLTAALWQALHEADRSRMRQVMAQALASAEPATQRERVVESRTYFERHWDGVSRRVKTLNVASILKWLDWTLRDNRVTLL